MLEIALMIITLTASGEPRLSLTETVSLEACQGIRATVVGVLEQRKTQVFEARCGANNVALTPYVHGAQAEDYQHYYRVTLLADEGFTLAYFPSAESCRVQATLGKNVHCVLASQAPLN